MEAGGNSGTHGFEAKGTKRLVGELQSLVSEDICKNLNTDGAGINGTSAGNTLTYGRSKSSVTKGGDGTSIDRWQRNLR